MLYIVEEVSDFCPPLFAEQLFSRWFPLSSSKVAPSSKAAPKDRTKGIFPVSPEIKVYINTYTKSMKIRYSISYSNIVLI